METHGTTNQNRYEDINAKEHIFHRVVEWNVKRGKHQQVQQGKKEPQSDIGKDDGEYDFTDDLALCHLGRKGIGHLRCGDKIPMQI